VNHAIRDDVRAQVDAFALRVRKTLDPDHGPGLEDGDGFDRRLAELDEDFARVKRVYHDYLVASWSDDAVRAMRAAAGAPAEKLDDAPVVPSRTPVHDPARPGLSTDPAMLGRRMWFNWLLLASSGLVTVCVLAAATLPLVRDRADTPWPWRSTETVLLVALSVAIAAFVGYLTRQQRMLASLQAELAAVRDAAVSRMRRHCDRLRALLDVSRTMGAETDVDGSFDSITTTSV
jgi:hypothetical protein